MPNQVPSNSGLQSDAYRVQDQFTDVNTRLSRIEGQIGSLATKEEVAKTESEIANTRTLIADTKYSMFASWAAMGIAALAAIGAVGAFIVQLLD